MKKRVLVADDDVSIRESLRKLLEETGYEVSLAVNGRDALRKLKARRADILLLDLEMPERDGWDVLEAVAADRAPLPVLVITGRGEELHSKLIPGSRALLEKPVDVELLLERIEQLLHSPDDGVTNGRKKSVEILPPEAHPGTQESSRSRYGINRRR